jgi:hypothetical protein
VLLVDVKTGELLNENIKYKLIEYAHDYCEKKRELVNMNKSKVNKLDQIEKNNNLNKNFSLNFDMDMYDLFDDFSSTYYSKNFNSKQIGSRNSSKRRCVQRRHSKRRRLNASLLSELIDNLIFIKTSSKYSMKRDEQKRVYYLIYFCSNFTTSCNTRQVYDQVVEFLNYIKEKIECTIEIVIVSSDHFEDDYKKLIQRYSVEKAAEQKASSSSFSNQTDDDCFIKLALKFDSRSVKEKLFHKLHITGIPWFSLIDATNGDILCENIKIFILNSQLREMIF